MVWFGVAGIVALILAALHFFSSETIRKMDKFGSNVIITMEDMVKKHPKWLGFFYLIGGAVLVYFGFFFKSK